MTSIENKILGIEALVYMSKLITVYEYVSGKMVQTYPSRKSSNCFSRKILWKRHFNQIV